MHSSRGFGENAHLDAAKPDLDFLNSAPRMPAGGYAWVLNKREIEDSTRHCYGHAFVLLAVSAAAHAGIEKAQALVGSVCDLLENRAGFTLLLPSFATVSSRLRSAEDSNATPVRGVPPPGCPR